MIFSKAAASNCELEKRKSVLLQSGGVIIKGKTIVLPLYGCIYRQQTARYCKPPALSISLLGRCCAPMSAKTGLEQTCNRGGVDCLDRQGAATEGVPGSFQQHRQPSADPPSQTAPTQRSRHTSTRHPPHRVQLLYVRTLDRRTS